MQTRTGVDYSSLACLVIYGLFYRCEKKTYYYLDLVYVHMWWSLRGGVVFR